MTACERGMIVRYSARRELQAVLGNEVELAGASA
jgi:hypothetical protein